MSQQLRARVQALPLWRGSVEPKPLTGGLSNQSFTVNDGGDVCVVRFGDDYPFHHVYRDRELMSARAAHAVGVAPEVVHAQPGVMVSRFIKSRTFEAGDVADNIERIAALAKTFHQKMPDAVSGAGFMFWVFHVIRDYANTLRLGNSPRCAELPGYLALNSALEAVQISLPIIYGHNDLLPANILDDGERLWLIDFEYAGFSTAMFDLAGLASNAQFDQQQSDFLLRTYFGGEVDESYAKSHMAMQCASLLREAMWSMVSELHLNTPGVNFEAYTEENLARLEAALDAYSIHHGTLQF